MSEVKVNGKIISTEAALELLKKGSVKVTDFSMTTKNEDRKTDVPLSNEGFAIDKDMIASMSAEMDRMNADRIQMTLSGSPYIMNRTLILIIEEPKPEPTWIQSKFQKLGKYLIELGNG